MEPRTGKTWTLAAAAVLLAAFVLQTWFFLRHNSQTFDEGVHLSAGYSYLARGDFRLNPEHPPLLKMLAALPVYLVYRLPFEPSPHLWREAEKWAISREFFANAPVATDDLLTAARLPGLVLGLLLVGLTGWWASRLWGRGAGLLALSLAAFEPNLIAHSGLVTTDVGSALFILLTLYLLWEYGRSRSLGYLLGCGAALGLALASKFSSILLIGMGGLLVIAHVALPSAQVLSPPAERASTRLSGRVRQAIVVGLVVTTVAFVLLLPVYFFQGWGSWLSGLRWQLGKGESGHPGFFMGDYSTGGWFTYFPVAFLIKTPVGSIVLIAAGLLLPRVGTPLRLRDALFLLIPIGVFLIIVMRGRINIGLRYLVPVYPFLFLLASRLATVTTARPKLGACLVGLPALLTAASSVWVAPHHLAYFNELVGGPSQGHRYLSDSNLDWGQGLKGLKEFMDREGVDVIDLSYFGTALPEFYDIRYREAPACSPVVWPPRPPDNHPPRTGRFLFAIGVTCLQGVYFEDKTTYHWLLARQPIARIGHAIHIYDLTDDEEGLRLFHALKEQKR